MSILNILASTGKSIGQILKDLWASTGFANIDIVFLQNIIMLGVACLLFYLAIVKKFEPNLLLGIAFGAFIINIPGAKEVLFLAPTESEIGGLFYYLNLGVKLVIFPPLIFLGIGAMTDFGPLIANPKSLLLGAAAQLGIFVTFIGALMLPQFDELQSAAIAIIGGADGPTAIYLSSKLIPDQPGMMAAIAIAAYSYMALVPVIQPPIMKLLTTKQERLVKMDQLRVVSKKEKILFPIIVTAVVGILVPASLPLLGMLMFGNLMKETGIVPRLTKCAENELINIVTIFLGIVVGTKAYGPNFLNLQTLLVIVLGVFAFSFGTAGGVLLGKLMCKLTHGKVNPLIGAAGVSAVPMAARVAQDVGQKEDPSNFLLMHAMGPNVAGVIGSAVVAGVLLAIFG